LDEEALTDLKAKNERVRPIHSFLLNFLNTFQINILHDAVVLLPTPRSYLVIYILMSKYQLLGWLNEKALFTNKFQPIAAPNKILGQPRVV
jgi:ABC-type tungstate transport system substrate-binding protein